MCESLLLQAPGGAVEPGLATVSNPSPTTMVFTLRPGVKFWDGHPVTSADVVYSLDRQMNPGLGGFNVADFSRVASVTATSRSQVTIKLKQPDYWLEGELASIPGIIIEKSFAENLQPATERRRADGRLPSGGAGDWPEGGAQVGVRPGLHRLPRRSQIQGGHRWSPGVDYADPAALLNQVVLPGGLQNLDNFSDPAITAALEQARSTANLDQRAALVAKAEELAAQQLLWIPGVELNNVLVLSRGLTGAVSSTAYLFSPGPTVWARAG